MIWNAEYQTLSNFRAWSPENEVEIMERAYNYARDFFPNAEPDDFVIIIVEGYNCITVITDERAPKEIADEVVPFDDKKVYPLQGIKQEVTFKLL